MKTNTMVNETDTKIEVVAPDHFQELENVDTDARNSLGTEEVQSGYWTSPRLLGSVLANSLMANVLFFGVAMPVNIISIINADIGPSPNAYLVSFLFQLFYGALHLLCSRLSDITGRRYFMIGGQIIMVVGWVICSRANSINTLIAGSAVAGVGGAAALMFPAIMHELVPNKHRPFAQAFILFSVIPSCAFGPAIARGFVDSPVGWRGIYYLMTAISGLSAILYFFCYFPPNFYMINSKLSKWQELRSLDYIGLLLYLGGLVLVTLGFTWAQGSYPWKSPHVIASLVIGALLLIAFGFWEVYMPLRQPLLPMRLFKLPNYTAAIFIGSTMQMVWIVQSVFWPIQIVALFQTDIVTTGLLSCTTGAGLALGELVFSPFYRFVGRIRLQLAIACAMVAGFTAASGAITASTKAMAIAFTVLAGIGVGWIEMVTLVTVGLVAPPNDIGVAQGFFNSIRQTFGIIAVSIFLSIYTTKIGVDLPRDVTHAAETAGLPASSITDLLIAVGNGTAAALEAVPGMTTNILESVSMGVEKGYYDTLQVVYLATLAFTGIGLLATVFIKDVDSYLTDYVNKTIHKPVMAHAKADRQGEAV